MSLIRSILHALFMSLTVIPYTLTILLLRVFGASSMTRYKVARAWLKLAADSTGWICGLKVRTQGMENLPVNSAQGVVLRDPLGLRPLCFATDGPLFAAASESVPLLNMGFPHIQSLPPGIGCPIESGNWAAR